MRDVSRYFIHTVLIERGPIGGAGTGTDQYGEPVVAATPTRLSINARVEFDNRRIINSAGEEIVCEAIVFLPWTYVDGAGVTQNLDLGGQDRIIFEARTYAIERRDRQEGWTGDRGRHWVAYIR
jgi:hypothetical protein